MVIPELHLIRWKKAFAVGGYILEPDVADHTLAVQWLAIALVVFARLLLVILVSILQQVDDVTLAPLWILIGLILASTTYTSITLIHRSQWNDLEAALATMAPDWIPRLSRDVGGRVLALATIIGMLILDLILALSAAIWVVGVGFLFLDLMPTGHFKRGKSADPCTAGAYDSGTESGYVRLKYLLSVSGQGVHVLKTNTPEILLFASEQLVRGGEPITVLGPDAEFLPGTLRSNFAWDASEIGDYHFSNLMELIGLQHWRKEVWWIS